MILNQGQAKAVFDAFCALNAVGLAHVDLTLEPGGGQIKAPRVLHSFSRAVQIYGGGGPGFRFEERYEDQAVFIEAYGVK